MESNKLIIDFGQIENIVIIKFVNIPDWANNSNNYVEIEDSVWHLSNQYRVAPVAITWSELKFCAGSKHLKNKLFCNDFATPQAASIFINNMRKLIAKANETYAPPVQMKTDESNINWVRGE